ncbi:hypothetical protein D3C81_777530 [compost metagenome]
MSGTMVTATRSENNSEITMVQASGTKNLPTIPGTKASGRKTATVVSVEEVMAEDTSRVACSTSSESRS